MKKKVGSTMNIAKVFLMSSLLLFFVLPNVIWRKLSTFLYEYDPDTFRFFGS